MIIERQLDHYGRHLETAIDELDVTLPAQPSRAIRVDVAPGMRRGWLIAASAAAIVMVMAVAWMLFLRDEPAAESTFVGPGTTETEEPIEPATTLPVTDGLMGLQFFPIDVGPEFTLKRSEKTLWGFDDDGGVLAYDGWAGAWTVLSGAPGRVFDVTGDLDGADWAATDAMDPIVRLDGNDWISLADERLRGEEVTSIATVSGTVWFASPTELFGWDGLDLTVVESPMLIDRIAVTPDGSVWASRFNPFFADLPAGLMRYDPGNRAWYPVRPLGGSEDVPAVSVAPDGAGGLWTVLQAYADWPGRATLAHLDGETGRWTTYDIPDGLHDGMTVVYGTVWLFDLFDDREALRFDRRTWTRFQADAPIGSMGAGPDGTIWVSADGAEALYRVATAD